LRSHPPALLKIVERTLREECAIERGSRILLAVSGGGDSCALMHVLERLRKKLGFTLAAHGVDHGLRPEAGAELDLAQALSRDLGIEFGRSRLALEPGGNLQARARAARYRALDEAAGLASASLIATAHHADDRAETVLLRLLRGAVPAGLGVLPARAGKLIRPLIRARKSDILAHLARHQLRFAEDPSNSNRRFLRVRVRHELLPLLEELSPQIVRHLNALADELRAGPPPVVLDEALLPIRLGRSQVAALRRAQTHGLLGLRLRLRGGRELALDPRTRRPVLRVAEKQRVNR
jgi:tRNA(Ile)-lysidine synthase